MVDPTYVLALMLRAETHPERSPWRATYEATADAVAEAASANPLFKGPRGAEETAAQVVGLMWFESHFQPDAKGDRACLTRAANGDCTKRGEPQSFCAMQVGESNFKGLGVTREELLTDIRKCVSTGLRLMHVSYRVCAGRPLEERLSQYCTGGGACVRPPNDESGHRVRKGVWLFRNVPPPGSSTRVDERNAKSP